MSNKTTKKKTEVKEDKSEVKKNEQEEKSKWQSFTNKTKEKLNQASEVLMTYGGKIGNQRHMAAIRDAFSTFMPFIIIGAVGIAINSIFIAEWGLIADLAGVEPGSQAYENWAEVARYLSPIFNGLAAASLDLLAVAIVFLLGYHLANSYGVNGMFPGVLSLATWFTFDPFGAASAHGAGPNFFFTANGLFVSLFIGLTVPMLFIKVNKIEKLKIKMPEGVPPAVAGAFNSMFAIMLSLGVFALIQPIWGMIAWGSGIGRAEVMHSTFLAQIAFTIDGSPESRELIISSLDHQATFDYINSLQSGGALIEAEVIKLMNLDGMFEWNWEGITISNFGVDGYGLYNTLEVNVKHSEIHSNVYHLFGAIMIGIAEPLQKTSVHPGTVFALVFLIGLLWVVGLHGHNILAPILESTWGIMSIQNMSYYRMYGSVVQDINWVGPNGETMSPWTFQSLDIFTKFGGSGATLALVVGMIWISKSQLHKQVGKVALAPGIFQINEPVIFGLPIILNPIYAIPFMLTSPFLALIGYGLTSGGVLSPTILTPPWVTPLIINGFLATLDWRAFIWCTMLFALSFMTFIPFLLVDAKRQIANEQNIDVDKVGEYLKKENELKKQKAKNKGEKGSIKDRIISFDSLKKAEKKEEKINEKDLKDPKVQEEKDKKTKTKKIENKEEKVKKKK